MSLITYLVFCYTAIARGSYSQQKEMWKQEPIVLYA